MLIAAAALLSVSGCEWILEQLPGDQPGGDPAPDPLPVLSIAAEKPVEEGGALAFRVTLSRDSDATVTARYRTEAGTAQPELDFEAVAARTITLRPGTRRQTITVQTLPDQDEEGSETLTVRITSAQNARLGTAAATGTILGDDDTRERAVTVAPGVHRSARLETGDDVDYYRVVVRASGAVIAATDGDHLANPGKAVVEIEPDAGNAGFAPLPTEAPHIQAVRVTATDADPAIVYIKVSGNAATPYDLAVWVVDRQEIPWFFDDTEEDSFDIELRYVGEKPSAAQQAIIREAADVWERIITRGVPDRFIGSSSVICDPGDPSLFGTHVDDLVVYIKLQQLQGIGGTLAQAGPCWTRLPSHLPYLGIVILDSDDLQPLQHAGVLGRIVTHEIAHTLGFGTTWDQMAGPDGLPLLRQPSLDAENRTVQGRDTYFSGHEAAAAFDRVGGGDYRGGAKVPVENDTGEYGPGSLDAHWRESVFAEELMTSRQAMAAGTNEPLSPVTVAAFADMGYVVDFGAAEEYSLPQNARRTASATAPLSTVVHLAGDVRPIPPVSEDPGTVPQMAVAAE
jgi:hypothetical protein